MAADSAHHQPPPPFAQTSPSAALKITRHKEKCRNMKPDLQICRFPSVHGFRLVGSFFLIISENNLLRHVVDINSLEVANLYRIQRQSSFSSSSLLLSPSSSPSSCPFSSLSSVTLWESERISSYLALCWSDSPICASLFWCSCFSLCVGHMEWLRRIKKRTKKRTNQTWAKIFKSISFFQ